MSAPTDLHRQRDQPAGVPPLTLTGERTLPDVPAENYWYRRHLVVYEWIAPRVAGRHVVDLASGEGYGADVLAASAATIVGIEPDEKAYEHARLRYPSVAFRRDLAECFEERCDAIAFLQTIEHVADPVAVLAHVRSQLRPGGIAYVSTPNVLTLAPGGAAHSGNPWHVREYRAAEFRALCADAFDGAVDVLGVFHARRLRLHDVALRRLRWDDVHRRLRLTRPFYDRFVAAIATSDFALRAGDLDRALDFVAVCRR